MALFTAGQEIVQPTPTIQANELPPGTYRFQLIVVDDLNQKSAPVVVEVKVRGLPLAVIKPVPMVQPGTAVVLDGSGSSVMGGSIKEYRWTLLPPGM